VEKEGVGRQDGLVMMCIGSRWDVYVIQEIVGRRNILLWIGFERDAFYFSFSCRLNIRRVGIEYEDIQHVRFLWFN
jgi:hypothetical protein